MEPRHHKETRQSIREYIKAKALELEHENVPPLTITDEIIEAYLQDTTQKGILTTLQVNFTNLTPTQQRLAITYSMLSATEQQIVTFSQLNLELDGELDEDPRTKKVLKGAFLLHKAAQATIAAEESKLLEETYRAS